MALKLRDLFKARSTIGPSSDASAATPPAGSALPADPYTRALALQQQGQSQQALALFDEVVAQQPENAEAQYKRANSLNALGRWDEALAGYDRAVAINAQYAYAFCNRGTVLEKLGRREEALASYERAVAITPDPLAFYNRGTVLKELDRLEEALSSYEQAIALRSNYVEAYVNRGHLLQQQRRHQEALASYDRAIELSPGLAVAFLGRANALLDLSRLEDALASYERAIQLNPDYLDALIARAQLLVRLQRYEPALESFEQAIRLDPKMGQMHRGRAAVLVQLRRFEEAIVSYDRAVALMPDQKYLLGMRQYSKMQICDWSDWAKDRATLIEGLEAGKAVSVPLPMLALLDAPRLHRRAAEIFAREEHPPDPKLGAVVLAPRHERIRIGYFSPDFRTHAVSYLAAELFERHDRSRFEVTAFASGPECKDAMRMRLLGAFEHFIDIDRLSDVEATQLVRRSEIDIAVDLAGFTQHARTGIFSLRAAPIQIGYLGYPGSMGTDYHDYLVADCVLIPSGMEAQFAEKIVRLPHCYQPNDGKRSVSDREFSREELGLPATGFVFCCFNRAFKLTPETFDSWMRILRRVEGSVLWLSRPDPAGIVRLQLEATARGIDPVRIVFARAMPSPADHLGRQRSAGLFLDTWPFNAHTTASDALWAGLPVLTCIGETLPSRVAASLLTSVGLPELITRSPPEYEELAVRLATHPEELAALRTRLALNRSSAPLFDSARLARHLEAAFTQMYERYRTGLAPEDIDIGP